MFLKKALRITVFLAAIFLLGSGRAFAFDDGFEPAEKIDGKYFIIYYFPQLQVPQLIQNLNVASSDNLMVGKSLEKKPSAEIELADMLDTLFMRVSDILDMHIYSFQGSIKICQDQIQLKRIYKDLFGQDLDTHSFYVNNLNTIYVAAEDFKREILGHEIAHAVISRYFIVPPPVKIHEVLAMYVEYQLRKNGQ